MGWVWSSVRTAILAILLSVGPVLAWADPDKAHQIEYFFGRYTGSAQASAEGASAMARQSEVEISPSDEGFKISWTTLSLDASEPTGIRIRAASENFARTENPMVFHGVSSGDPLKGGQVLIARIKEQTLSVSIFSIDENGGTSLATWDRTRVGDNLKLVFTRVRDGEMVRQAEGDLVKVDNLNEAD